MYSIMLALSPEAFQLCSTTMSPEAFQLCSITIIVHRSYKLTHFYR